MFVVSTMESLAQVTTTTTTTTTTATATTTTQSHTYVVSALEDPDGPT